MSLERRLGLRDDETLLSIVRRAPATLALPLGCACVLIIAPFFFLVPLFQLGIFGQVVVGASIAIGACIVLRVFLDQRASFLAVTDRRLILVSQRGPFSRHVTELPYSRIQRVSYRVEGLLPTLLRHGTILIESAGNNAPLAIERVSHPARTQDLINELMGGPHGGFGDMLHAISHLDRQQLGQLRSEIERSLRDLPPAGRP